MQAVGPIAKIQLRAQDFGVDLNVELTSERFAELQLKAGDRVFVSPRKVRVFVPEYSI